MKINQNSPYNVNQAICGVLFALTALTACTKVETTAKDSKATESTAPATNQCSKDTDCKGDRICDKGICTAPSNTAITANSAIASTASNKTTQKEVDKNYGAIEHGATKSFTPYAGKWYFIDSNILERSEQRVANVVTPDNTKAIAALKRQCGQEFAYTFDLMTGKAIQENIDDSIKSVTRLLQIEQEEDKKAGDNNRGRITYLTTLQLDIDMAKTMKQKFDPKREYWTHTYRCGDGSRDTYYVSPSQAITLEYAGGETQLTKTVR